MSSLFGSEPKKPRSYADRARDGLASLGQKASDAQFEAEGLLGLRPKTAEEQLYEACCPSLSYQTRLIGFCACMFASFILALFASFMLRRLLWRGDAGPFAVAYTLDNVVAILGSMFMAGPTAQLKTMCAPKRRVSTTIYVLALALTLFFAFATQVPDGARFGCILASLFVQWLALMWYTLSYVPFAHDYICSCLPLCCADCCGVSSSASKGGYEGIV